jgi:hypothetical protein
VKNRRVTGRGCQVYGQLKALDDSVPTGQAVLAILSEIARLACAKHQQDEGLCNHAWAGEPRFEVEREATRDALRALGEELTAAWPGSRLCLQNDPRGFVVRIEVPNGNKEAWAGGLGIA